MYIKVYKDKNFKKLTSTLTPMSLSVENYVRDQHRALKKKMLKMKTFIKRMQGYN